MPIAGRKPFTEIFEVVQNELVRESAHGEESKYMGIVNQVYSNTLPAVLPEVHIKKEAFFTLVADYTTGTVTVGSGTSNIIGSGTTWTSDHNDALIKVSGFDFIYRVTQAAATSLTYQDNLTWVASATAGASYTLLRDRYQLPSDFAFMLSDDPEDPHVVYRYVAGNKIYLEPSNEEEYERQSNALVGVPYQYCVKWIKEIPYLYLTMAADSAEILSYSYIPQLTTLTEYTTGTCAFSNGTAVNADSGITTWGVSISTGTNTYYIRNDADGTGSASKWVKILSIGGASSLTLASAWSYTSGAGQSYTISEISKWPTRFDDAILYKTALIVDPDNVQSQKWSSLYADAIGVDKSVESRRKQSTPLKEFWGQRK